MQITTELRDVSSNGIMQVARATIKANKKVFNFFSDQTYANKKDAIVREIAANAIDSQVMAGKADQPIEIWLPTELDPTFKVRDHGLGMSHEFMMGQFMAYADGSTKDGDNVAIGGFGIGSKSPFAYVDQFTIRSVYDGVVSVYSVFKDEEGIPSIGLLAQKTTEEENGVEVSFPVMAGDEEGFEESAFKMLRYFEPLPLVHGALKGRFEPPVYVNRGASWGMREEAGALNIVMGGVIYPVSTYSLKSDLRYNDKLSPLLDYGIDLRLPIGSCDVALSREALSYTERTQNAVHAGLAGVVDEIAASFATMFDQYDSPWEAASALYRETGGNPYSARAKFLGEHAKWKGEPFDTNLDYPRLGKEDMRGYQVWQIASHRDRRNRHGALKSLGSSKFEAPGVDFRPGQIELLVIDDLPQVPKSKTLRKIKELADETTGRIMVVRAYEHHNVSVQAIIDGFGNPPEEVVVLTSSLPEPIVEKTIRAKTANRPKVRMFTFDGSAQRHHRWGYGTTATNINPGQNGRPGVRELADWQQPSSGILVEMNSFDLPADLMNCMKYGLIDWDELYFVNSSDAKKMPKSNWQDWRKVWEDRKTNAISANPNLPTQLALANNSALNNLFAFLGNNPHLPELSRRTPLGKIQSLYTTYVQPLTSEQRKLAPLVEVKLPAKIKPSELLTELNTKQPKAVRLLSLLPRNLDPQDTQLFLENL